MPAILVTFLHYTTKLQNALVSFDFFAENWHGTVCTYVGRFTLKYESKHIQDVLNIDQCVKMYWGWNMAQSQKMQNWNVMKWSW